MADLHVAPDPLALQGVALHRHVAGLRQGQLQHEAAAVVRDAAHHVQAPGRSRYMHRLLCTGYSASENTHTWHLGMNVFGAQSATLPRYQQSGPHTQGAAERTVPPCSLPWTSRGHVWAHLLSKWHLCSQSFLGKAVQQK